MASLGFQTSDIDQVEGSNGSPADAALSNNYNNAQAAGYTNNSSTAGIQRMRKSFKQLRDLEKTLIYRITIVTLPVIAWTICITAIIADFVSKKESGITDIGVVSSYVFPWMSIAYVPSDYFKKKK